MKRVLMIAGVALVGYALYVRFNTGGGREGAMAVAGSGGSTSGGGNTAGVGNVIAGGGFPTTLGTAATLTTPVAPPSPSAIATVDKTTGGNFVVDEKRYATPVAPKPSFGARDNGHFLSNL